MFHWLNRCRIIQPDGKPNYHLVPAPAPSAAQEAVYEKEFFDPLYPVIGNKGGLFAGQVASQLNVVQPPQVPYYGLLLPTMGPGGVPVPSQTITLQELEDLTNG